MIYEFQIRFKGIIYHQERLPFRTNGFLIDNNKCGCRAQAAFIIFRMIYKDDIALLHFMYFIDASDFGIYFPNDLCSDKLRDP